MNESTLVPREEMSDLDWLARNVHVWPFSMLDSKPTEDYVWHQPHCGGDILVVFRDRPSVFNKDQWLARRAELQNKPSWGSHEFAVIAQGGNGYWYGSNVSEEKFGHEELFCITGTGWNYICDGIDLGDWRDTLEKRPEQDEFVPFVSMEEAAAAKQAAITPSKYTKTIRGVSVDVYDVLQAWSVSNPALQHLIKKALQCGQRGHKDNAQDLQDIIDSAIRAKELES